MTRIKQLAEGPTELDQTWGLRRDYFEIFMNDYAKSLRRLDPVLVELCRTRVAQMVESEFDLGYHLKAAVDAGLTAEKVAALTDYPTSDLFTEQERAVLDFTEQWVIQSSSITDEDCERIQTVITPEDFMYLCKALSVIDQFARANSALRIKPSATVPSVMPDFVSRDAVAA